MSVAAAVTFDEDFMQPLSVTHSIGTGGPLPTDLAAFLPYALYALQAPFYVGFRYAIQDEYVNKLEEKKRTARKSQAGPTNVRGTVPLSLLNALALSDSEDTVVITTVMDMQCNIVELGLHRCLQVPRLLLKLLALSAPYHPMLTRLSVRSDALSAAALYDLAQLVRGSYITDVCLDDSHVPEANYYLLLEDLPGLRRLSLDRCALGDEGAAPLAARLPHAPLAGRCLQALSLASNGIGDDGARALALALRSNRTLMHLNLAGNLVTDEGAAELFACLVEFPVTADEQALKKQRLMQYLRQRQIVYRQFYSQVMESGETTSDLRVGAAASAGKRRVMTRTHAAAAPAAASGSAAVRALLARVDKLTEDAVGTFSDPFSRQETLTRHGAFYCVGNFTLCYLNLAYNALGYGSAVALLKVLEYQVEARGQRCGLVRVVVEGNPLPDACRELRDAQELMENHLQMLQKSLTKLRKTKK